MTGVQTCALPIFLPFNSDSFLSFLISHTAILSYLIISHIQQFSLILLYLTYSDPLLSYYISHTAIFSYLFYFLHTAIFSLLLKYFSKNTYSSGIFYSHFLLSIARKHSFFHLLTANFSHLYWLKQKTCYFLLSSTYHLSKFLFCFDKILRISIIYIFLANKSWFSTASFSSLPFKSLYIFIAIPY